MSHNNPVHLNPVEAAKIVLSHLPSRRMRDVLEKRFGLKGGPRRTLEAIGREYRITRERVRQIEADALRHLVDGDAVSSVAPFFDALRAHLKSFGGMMSEHHLFSSFTAEKRAHPHLGFLLHLGKDFLKIYEDEKYASRWTINLDTARSAEKALEKVVDHLTLKGEPMPRRALEELITKESEAVLGEAPSTRVIEAYLSALKCVSSNPYGEYGLVSWPNIRPRGIRDKAYLVLEKSSKPIHFRETAKEIDRAGWNRHKAHPQTVHNELIKDDRFVLVGRGLYALKEWGYEPGAVRDVMISILRESGKALSREEIVGAVSGKRMVKPPTVILNLQNKEFFKRTEDGKYTLA